MEPPSEESKEKCPYLNKGCIVNGLLFSLEDEIKYRNGKQRTELDNFMNKYLGEIKKIVPALAEDVNRKIRLLETEGGLVVKHLREKIYNSWCTKDYSNCPQYEYWGKEDSFGKGYNISPNDIEGLLEED